jgi:hypothetical protein
MATNKTTAEKPPAATPAKADPNGYQIKAEDWGFTKDDTDSQKIAALSTRSALTATTFKAFAGGGDALEVTDLMGELRKAGEEVASGNMSRVEKMLAHQALTLDAIFNNMAQRSHKQDTFKGIEVLMRLALKAQAQARSTAEALALLKNPQPYIRQANMTTGPQQVNNSFGGTPLQGATQAGAGNIQSEQNKLLEADHGQRLDIRAQGAAGRTNPDLATVEAVNRSPIKGGKAAR